MAGTYGHEGIAEVHRVAFADALKQVRRLMVKQHFYVKLIPPRPTFPVDMTADERTTMQKHVEYTTELFAQGKVLIFGPVLDPDGPFGMAVFEVDDESEAHLLMNNDPSVLTGLNRFTVTRMKVGAAQGSSPR